MLFHIYKQVRCLFFIRKCQQCFVLLHSKLEPFKEVNSSHSSCTGFSLFVEIPDNFTRELDSFAAKISNTLARAKITRGKSNYAENSDGYTSHVHQVRVS